MTPKKGKSEEKARKEQEKAGMEAFAKELEANSDEEKEKASTAEGANKGNLQKESELADDAFDTNGVPLSEAERELIKEELKKTEDEITTLRQVLVARQKHASELKRKLGVTPLGELSQDLNKSLKNVTESEAFHRTAEVASATADTVKGKWNDMRNSSLFKSFESKLETAYSSAKMTASTSIDKLSGHARPGNAGGGASGVQSPEDETAKLP